MKVEKLIISNVGIIGEMELDFRERLLMILYGERRQGKTTVLNCIKWLAGGQIPKELIKEGQEEAFIEMHVENGIIRREFYVNKAGEFSNRPIQASINNRKLSQKDVTLLFNPFQLDQNFFISKNHADRKSFLLEIFGANTSVQDLKIKTIADESTVLRGEIKAFGEIDTVEVKESNLAALRSRETTIRTSLNTKVLESRKTNEASISQYNEAISEYSTSVHNWEREQSEKEVKINTCCFPLETLMELGYTGREVSEWIESFPKPLKEHSFIKPIQKELISEMPNQSELEAIQEKISNAKVENLQFEQYESRVKKQAVKDEMSKTLAAKQITLKSVKEEKGKLLQTISGKIEGLEFDENGDYRFLGTHASMMSDSEEMELSALLSSLYPQGLDLIIMDRGESMGREIVELIHEAEKTKSNILVTVVGKYPSDIDKKIGVFEVTNGDLDKIQ